MATNFESFLNDDQWRSLTHHFNHFPADLEANIDRAIEKDKRADCRKWLENEIGIRKADPKKQEILKEALMSGEVVGIDGTCSDNDFLTGFQARIAIVAVNYKNNKTDYVTYISEPFIDYSKEDIVDQLEYLRRKGAGKEGITGSHIRAIMLFKERDFALKRPEKFKMVQGDILPYELRTGQGKLRGLSSCLELGRKLLNEPNIVAVQANSSKPELRFVGAALQEEEYVELYDYQNILNAYLDGDELTATSPAHFNENDKADFKKFNDDVKGRFSLGVYKLKQRAYVFYAPRENFDLMANLVFADSKFQPVRGFPLLLDYADIVCSRLFSASDFNGLVEMKLAKKNVLEFEIGEKSLRRR